MSDDTTDVAGVLERELASAESAARLISEGIDSEERNLADMRERLERKLALARSLRTHLQRLVDPQP